MLENGEEVWNEVDYATQKKQVSAMGHQAVRNIAAQAAVARAEEDRVRQEEEEQRRLARQQQLEQEEQMRKLQEEEQMAALQAQMANGGSRSRGNSSVGVDVSKVPPHHKERLCKDASLAGQFDQIYGPGASAEILRQAGLAPPATKNKVVGGPPRKKPKPQHVEMLIKNPHMVEKFDQIYGEGAGAELLRRTGHGHEEETESAIDPRIPEEHIQKLRDNPNLASEFDRIYGPGTSISILSEGESEVLTLTLDPTQAPQAPDLPVINGVEVKQKHVDMLSQRPELADKFDQFYGKGSGKQVLNWINATQGGGGEDPREEEEAHYHEEAKGRDRAASSVYQKPAPVPKKPLQEKHVQMLKEKPSFAAKFDQVYGEGMAESILYDGAGSKKLLTADTYRGSEHPFIIYF